MLEDMLMPNETHHRVEMITGLAGRRYWLTYEKLRIIEGSLVPGESVSAVARRNGVAPNLLFRCRRRMDEGGAMAVGLTSRWSVSPRSASSRARFAPWSECLAARPWRTRSCAKHWIWHGQKKDVASAVAAQGRFPMSRVAEVLEVSRSQLHARASGVVTVHGVYIKADDIELLPTIRRFVGQRPTYGYRRLTALLNRERRGLRLEPVNRKRVLRILGQYGLTLERSTGRREGRVHDGKIAVMASNLRWCFDALEIGCWNNDKVRVAFIIDAFDREIIAHVAVADAGISGSDVRDMMLAAVERRFSSGRALHWIEHLSDNGSCYIAKDTRDFAAALGLVPCFTPVRSPESNGMSEAFVKTFKRDYVRVTPLPDAQTVLGLVAGWITDYNTVHPHSALCMRSPVKFRETLNPSRTVQ